ncbi:hypothetical protein QQP08_007238 [Theobroma cacao]|uniref:Uncharacterized protein n=1 Tax=Theobroma cacao TaxID=3641 RepID=A0A061DXV0_THECC|nr:Uncharacterized protein TCM_006291 [Theobroma cacao]WRX14751.1 hypothetical protein QQP08_007238 [Theobroma cacao]
MSGLVDKWRTELAKLREKGQTLFSSGSSPAAASGVESGQVVQQQQERSSNGLMQVFVTRVMCSEGSVSMLVHCFSP